MLFAPPSQPLRWSQYPLEMRRFRTVLPLSAVSTSKSGCSGPEEQCTCGPDCSSSSSHAKRVLRPHPHRLDQIGKAGRIAPIRKESQMCRWALELPGWTPSFCNATAAVRSDLVKAAGICQSSALVPACSHLNALGQPKREVERQGFFSPGSLTSVVLVRLPHPVSVLRSYHRAIHHSHRQGGRDSA
ncbi:hypothetical protein BD413DRAFT_129098 [Trametes elegans]|nr:hypothetical protein BD413DRAFT_129098 [Trametes elegans]